MYIVYIGIIYSLCVAYNLVCYHIFLYMYLRKWIFLLCLYRIRDMIIFVHDVVFYENCELVDKLHGM